MGTSLIEYIQLLELIAFFAGYPVVFMLVQVLAGPSGQPATFFKKLKKLLSISYALTGTVYLALIAKNGYGAYGIPGMSLMPANPLLSIWALLSQLMWFRFFRCKPVLAFVHSLVFFSLFAKDIYLYAAGIAHKETFLTDMKIYGVSIFINSSSLLFIYLISMVFRRLYISKNATPRL